MILQLQWRWPFISVPSQAKAVLPADQWWRDVRHRTWVRINETGQLAVLDHVKPKRRYGVRPVDYHNSQWFPSPWEHWPAEDRIRVPLEYDLSEDDFTVLTDKDLPF